MPTLIMDPIAIPLREDEHGSIRVGRTRVLLELVIRAFQDGKTPEEIVQSYDTLDIRDVYVVLGYYLTDRVSVDEYVRRSGEDANAIRREIEAAQPALGDLREQLLARARGGSSATKESGRVEPAER
jgi:uncharacterized protein (DUF433 family)